MKTTVIYAHPWHGSYNKAILDNVVEQLESRNKPYQVIDLNKDNFNPVLDEGDLSVFSKGEPTDKMVHHYQGMLRESDEIIFIFPIWWFDLPAILKGFIDKVMLKGFAYDETEVGLEGLLTHVSRTHVITTSEVPASYLKNSIEETFIRLTLKSIGLNDIKWLHCDAVSSSEEVHRIVFLNKVAFSLQTVSSS